VLATVGERCCCGRRPRCAVQLWGHRKQAALKDQRSAALRRVPPLYPLTRAHAGRQQRNTLGAATWPPSPIPFSLNSVRGRDDGARAFGADADDDGVVAAPPASHGVIANRRH